jgi:hypothetical protein
MACLQACLQAAAWAMYQVQLHNAQINSMITTMGQQQQQQRLTMHDQHRLALQRHALAKLKRLGGEATQT